MIGDIVITKYTKPSSDDTTPQMSVAETCSLFAIDGATCGQSDLDCKYVKYAKLAERSLQDGTCAKEGYTVKGSTMTKHYPMIGDIVITKYAKPSSEEAADFVAETCSLYAIDGATC